jgi:hypothetical protein
MADSFDMDAAFGNPKKQQAPMDTQFSGDQKPGKIDMDAAFGKSAPSATPSGKPMSPEDQEYENKVRSLLPKAREFITKDGDIASRGAPGAFVEGVGKIGEWTGLRTATRGAMAALGAGEGKNFSERYGQLKAEDEAVARAYDEKHAIAKGAGEIAGVVGTTLLAPQTLAISGPVEAAALARGLGPTAAKAVGMGAEGAAFGAGTAAGEQAFGTKSKQDEPGIINSALIGGGVGGALAPVAKGAGKLYEAITPSWASPSYAYEKLAPEFVQNYFGASKNQTQKIANWVNEGKGEMSLSDWTKAKEEGKPVTLYNLIDPTKHNEVAKMFEGRPDAAKVLQDRLATWSGDAQSSLQDFTQNLLKTKATPAEMEATATALAKQRVTGAYEAAKREGNGAGSWDSKWDKWLDSKTFAKALEDTMEEIREITGYRKGSRDLYEAPFRKFEESELKADPSDARAMAESFFAKKGVEPPAGIEYLGDGLQQGRYQLVNPQSVDVEFLDILQRHLNKMADSRLSVKNTPGGGVGAEIANARQQIMDSLTNPKSSLYNKEYAEALRAHNNAERTENSFSYGKKIWDSAKNARKSSEIADDISAMSPREKFYVAHGLMEEAIARSSRPDGAIDVNVLNKMLANQYTKQAVMNSLGPRRYEEFERHLRTQTALSNAIKSSQALGAGSNFEQVRDVRYLLYALAYDRAALMTVAYRWADEKIGGAYAKDLARKLASDDIGAFKDGLKMIHSSPKNNKSFGDYLVQSAPSIIGTMAGGRADGGAVHMNSGGAVHMQDGGVPPRELDERGMYSEGAETARRILPKAQGSGPEFIQRLLGKGVRPDELHHTRIDGLPLRHMGTGELHPAVQGQIGGHELADLIHNNAPKMERINRNDSSRDYKPTYTSRGLKLNAAKDYSELNVAKPTNLNQEVFTPPAEDYTILPQTTGYSAYARQNAKNPSNTPFMPIDDLSEIYSSNWDHQKNTGRPYARTHDRFGNYHGLITVDDDVSGENFAEKRSAFQQAAQKNAASRYKNKVSPTMEHFTDVPNLAYHARMSDIPLQKDGKPVSNLNIEEAQSDAARRYDRGQRRGGGYTDTSSYNPKVHKKMYEDAVAAQERLRTTDEPFYKTEQDNDKKIIENYENYLEKLTGTDAIPDVPHIESNKSWQRALAKDVLRKAASEGYESITVTPWEEQVRRARHSEPVDKLMISSLPVKQGSNSPETFAILGYPINMEMDDLKKIYGDRIETLIRNHIPEGQRGHAVLPSDPYGKKPFYAFLPNELDINPDDNDEVQDFIANAIDGGKRTRRKAEVHNAFVKQLQNVINEEHDPHFKIDYSHSDKHEHPDHLFEGSDRSKLVAPGAFLSPELRDSIFKKGFKRFKKGGYVTDNLTKPIDPAKGYAFGGSANQMRMVNKSIHMPKPGDADFVGPTMSNSSYDPNKSGVFDKLNMFGERNIHWTPDLGHASSRGYRVDKTGRTMRSTGGRIPDADKLFKSAKKYVDSHTKHLLDVPDDAIVKALRVAQKKV